MSEHDDEREPGGGDVERKPERSATGRKKRSDAGTTRGGGSRKPSSRFQRRSQAAQETIRELIRLGRPDLDVEGKTFVEIVERDASAWGAFVAQLGEWFVPFGAFVDLAFGSPLVVLLNMAPSVRAARRDLAARRERLAAERERAAEDEELRQRIAEEHGTEPGGGGIFQMPQPGAAGGAE